MRRFLAFFVLALALAPFLAVPTAARDKPNSTATLNAFKLLPSVEEFDNVGPGTPAGS